MKIFEIAEVKYWGYCEPAVVLTTFQVQASQPLHEMGLDRASVLWFLPSGVTPPDTLLVARTPGNGVPFAHW